MRTRSLALLAAAFAAGATLPAVAPAQSAPADSIAYPLEYAQLSQFIISLLPPGSETQVRNLRFAERDGQLQAEAEARLGSLPGLELLGGLGWQRVTAVGPVSLMRPGTAAWDIRTVEVGGFPVMMGVWAPLVQRLTRRRDTLIPVPVPTWVTSVQVDSTRLLIR